MRISQTGLDLIKTEEGTVLYPYDDSPPKDVGRRLVYQEATGKYLHQDGSPPRGRATIGTGHLIRPGEVFAEITMEQNDDILRADISDVESALRRQVPDDTPGWNQHRYDAACDFGINCGDLALTKYDILPFILANDWVGLQAPWRSIRKSRINGVLVVNPVLVHRRDKELELAMTPMPETVIDQAAVLELVRRTSDQSTEEFRRGSPLPDDEEAAVDQATPEKEA